MKVILNENKKKKALGRRIVGFIILSIFTFTGVAVWLQYKIGMELSPTLITCFYGFCTGELWILAGIKKTKVKENGTVKEESIDGSSDNSIG